jgi:hypothetical protein
MRVLVNPVPANVPLMSVAMYVPKIVVKYVPGVPVLKFAVTAQLVPPVPQVPDGVKDGLAKPAVATAVKVIESVLATGHNFSAIAVIVADAGPPFGTVIIVVLDVIATYGLLAGSPRQPVLAHDELGICALLKLAGSMSSGTGFIAPLFIVTHVTCPAMLVAAHPVWKPMVIPVAGEVPVML